MAGHGLSLDDLKARQESAGLFTRLASHASGRRSGAPFCVSVCDRLGLPALSHKEREATAVARLPLDLLTRDDVHWRFSFR
jgi:hypothetical protein